MLDDYEWHFDYTRLIRDTGFKIQINRPKSSIVNNIAHIDIQKVVLHQDIQLIDKNINTVLQFSLDNEQTSILDPNFVKIFQISQLAVQYLLFCKIYLDNTVAHLKKEDVKSKEQTNKLNCHIEELKRDAANLKTEIQQLQATLSCQVASTQNIAVFQCNQCPKAFSTEEYLLAHIQRRHESFGHGTSFQVETDKLQSEIKALKERLNNTEKYIHSDDEKFKNRNIDNMSIKNNNVENTLLTDLQHKFELLKMHVDNELRILQTQKFDQEKYEQWFGTFLNKLDDYNNDNKNLKPLGTDTVKDTVKEINVCATCQIKDKNAQKQQSSTVQIERSDNATQTDFADASNQKVCKHCEVNYSSLEDQTNAKTKTHPEGGYLSDKELHPHFEKLEEMLQERVTGSIEKLENQMQSFCNKMSELEKQNLTSMITSKKSEGTPISAGVVHENEMKVVPKPRKKWSATGPIDVLPHSRILNENIINPKSTKAVDTVLSTPNIMEECETADSNSNSRNTDKTSTNIRSSAHTRISTEIPTNSNIKDVIVISTPNESVVSSISVTEEIETADSNSSINYKDNARSEKNRRRRKSDSSTDTCTKTKKVAMVPVKPKLGTSAFSRSLTSLKKESGEVQKSPKFLLNKQLTELGVSPDWLTIPTDSYQRAIQMVTHQSNLIKKKFPNYKKILDTILRDVDKRILEKKTSTQHVIMETSRLGKDSDKQIEKPYASNKPKTITMYDSASETDSDETPSKRKTLGWGSTNIPDQTQKKYYNVIQELNAKTKSSEILVEPIPSPKNDGNDDGKTELAKSVLKNYPSVTSLHKKKVFFNLKSSDASGHKEIPLKGPGDGSTSSIGSSVFDGSKTNLVERINKKDVWDISDSDLSEILK